MDINKTLRGYVTLHMARYIRYKVNCKHGDFHIRYLEAREIVVRFRPFSIFSRSSGFNYCKVKYDLDIQNGFI